jgi:hypothetical protein
MIHDFNNSLEKSHQYADAPWWGEVYRQAFPGLQASVSVRADTWAQRAGIDRVLTLISGRTITIDEKVRERDWPDILLERWSSEETRIPGWIQKDLHCEFIAYAFVPSATCYLLPTLTLQRAWRLYGREWIARYQEIRARNNDYTSVSVAVPTDVLFGAIGDAMCVHWEPEGTGYDPDDDFARSIEESYREIRERKASGGPGWEPPK